jgi:L-amino acid N-acyltransferase YncA
MTGLRWRSLKVDGLVLHFIVLCFCWCTKWSQDSGIAAALMKIRTASIADAEAIAAIYAPIVLETAISFEWAPPTAEEFRQRIAKVLARYAWLVATDEAEQIAGYVFASGHKDAASYLWSVNTSVYIRADSRRRGVGGALYTELFRQLASLGYHRAFAGVALPNAASIALHQSVGFKPVGVYRNVGFKFGAWRDVSWWQRDLQPPELLPQKPPSPWTTD